MEKEIILLLYPIQRINGGGTVKYAICPKKGDGKYFKEKRRYFFNNIAILTDFGYFFFNSFNRKVRALTKEGVTIELRRGIKDRFKPQKFTIKDLEDLNKFYEVFY